MEYLTEEIKERIKFLEEEILESTPSDNWAIGERSFKDPEESCDNYK